MPFILITQEYVNCPCTSFGNCRVRRNSLPTQGRLVKRIALDGNALGMTLDKQGARLFVAEDNADQVAVIDTVSNKVISKIDARAPESVLPDGRSDRDGR